jgi:hypothetical protein
LGNLGARLPGRENDRPPIPAQVATFQGLLRQIGPVTGSAPHSPLPARRSHGQARSTVNQFRPRRATLKSQSSPARAAWAGLN